MLGRAGDKEPQGGAELIHSLSKASVASVTLKTGTEREAIGCYRENIHKCRGSVGLYQRKRCIPERCPESLLSRQNAACAWWISSCVLLQHFSAIFQPQSHDWHKTTTIIVWANVTSFESSGFPRHEDRGLRAVLERYQFLRRLKLEAKWYKESLSQ